MNENHENKNHEKDQAEPFTKKAAKVSAFVYLGLAITVVVVATVGIFSMSFDYEESLPQVSFPEINYNPQEEVSLPEISLPDVSEKPVGNEESDVDAELDPPETPTFVNPVSGEILKDYSMEHLVFSKTMGDYRVHSGVDVSAPVGTEVVCFTDGKVASVSDDYFFGTTVTITHQDGLVSYYMNLDPEVAENVSVGEEIAAGELIGKVGNTAKIESADEPHLHFELRVNGELINPGNKLP